MVRQLDSKELGRTIGHQGQWKVRQMDSRTNGH